MVDRILGWMRNSDQRTAARVLIDRRGALLTYELLETSENPGALAYEEFMKMVRADAERYRRAVTEGTDADDVLAGW
jgi:hypothetical protein